MKVYKVPSAGSHISERILPTIKIWTEISLLFNVIWKSYNFSYLNIKGIEYIPAKLLIFEGRIKPVFSHNERLKIFLYYLTIVQ